MNTSLVALFSLMGKSNEGNCFAIDVGAHHGEYANFLIKSNIFNKVVSFEPNAESYSRLLNEVSATTTCQYLAINSALSSASGTSDLYCDADTATASLLPYENNYQKQGREKKYTVSVLTLDEYLSANMDFGELRFIKIDTQGHDLSVINGGIDTILKYRPIIQVEFIYVPLYKGQTSPAELSEILLKMGYEIYAFNNLHVSPEGRLAFCDAIFIPKKLNIPITQRFSCIDDQISYQNQIQTLTNICAERLDLINFLDAEVRRLNSMGTRENVVVRALKKVKLWGQ